MSIWTRVADNKTDGLAIGELPIVTGDGACDPGKMSACGQSLFHHSVRKCIRKKGKLSCNLLPCWWRQLLFRGVWDLSGAPIKKEETSCWFTRIIWNGRGLSSQGKRRRKAPLVSHNGSKYWGERKCKLLLWTPVAPPNATSTSLRKIMLASKAHLAAS